MPKIFCMKCNQSTDYTSKSPSYCSHCGKPYIDVSNASKPQTIAPKIKPCPIQEDANDDNLDDIDNEIIDTPQIDSFDVEIQGNLRGNRENLKQLKGQEKLGIKRQKPKSSNKNLKINERGMQRIWANKFPKNARENPSEIE